jgi:fimbrial chaperone protein
VYHKIKSLAAPLSHLSVVAAMTFGCVTSVMTVPAPAAAMAVRPVIIDLGVAARSMSTTLEVSNAFPDPLTVELTVREVTFGAEEGVAPTFKPTEDILIFPPQALVAPGAAQNFRVQYLGDPAIARSRHFVVTVAQLPVRLPEGQSAIQVLYNFQVLVSVGVPGTRSDIKLLTSSIVRNASGDPNPVLEVRNDTPTYGYLGEARLRLVQKDAAGAEIYRRSFTAQELQQTVGFGLVAPGQTRKITVPIKLPSADGTLSAEITLEPRRK